VNPNLPVGGSALDIELGSEGLPEDVTQVAFTGSYGLFNRTLDGHAVVDDPLGPRIHSALGNLTVRHHFAEGWSAEASVPAGLVELSQGGAESRRLAGFGDIALAGRYDWAGWWGAGGYRPSLSTGLSLVLPTGRQAKLVTSPEVPPNLLGIGGGAFGFGAETVYTQFLHKQIALSVPVSFRVPLTRSEIGRRPGHSYRAGLAGVFLPGQWLLLRVGAEWESLASADQEGEGTVINSGGDWLRAEALIGFRIAAPVLLAIGGRVPFYADVHGRQVSETFGVNATMAFTFGAKDEDEHDHDHGHEDAHEHGGGVRGDVQDAAMGGASFVVDDAIAPGKITVIDFWADWCHPCHHIDRALRELAASHPDLAVRRVEAPDVDAAVVTEHLGGQLSLPQVWIFGRDGKLVDMLVGTSEAAVTEQLGALLAP
jgi:thioredoxin 1